MKIKMCKIQELNKSLGIRPWHHAEVVHGPQLASVTTKRQRFPANVPTVEPPLHLRWGWSSAWVFLPRLTIEDKRDAGNIGARSELIDMYSSFCR